MIPRLAAIALAMTAGTAQSAELDENALVARLARPAPDTTSFVEVRYSKLLETPLVVAGQLEHRADGALVRRVDSPYQEVTELQGENVRVARAGTKPREFSLDRAPELRGMLASFGALLEGDRAQLERYFAVTTSGTDAHWQLTLTPRDAKLQRRLASIAIQGGGDRARCFTLAQPDGGASVLALGVATAAALPQPPERRTLAAWCAEAGGTGP